MIPSVVLLANRGGAGGGGGGSLVNITDRSVSDYQLNTDAGAEWSARNNGNVYNQNNVVLETWLLSGVVADYEIRATLVSGTTPSGTALNTWASLSNNRSWSVTATNPGGPAGNPNTVSCTLTVEIRTASNSIVRDTATISLTATSEFEF